jgi:hypothetical protein
VLSGVITTRDVLLHMPTIAQAFGWGVLLHALYAVLSGRRTTFLALAWESSR